MLVAHAGPPRAPSELWSSWHADPLLLAALLLAAVAYVRGRRHATQRVPRGVGPRDACFAAALAVLALALLSPLDALSAALASAHMVQHVLLVLVAAPLLALSAPVRTLLDGAPARVRALLERWSRPAGERLLRAVGRPVPAWLLHAGVLWFWHAAGAYDAALDHHAVHGLEHGAFLLTGALFWRVVLGPPDALRVPPGAGILLVFGMALQSVFLSLLLTFATAPWYAGYAGTTRSWGLEPLADQQLAGVIMWVPAGFIYLAAALALLVEWVQTSEVEAGQMLVSETRSTSSPS